MSLNVMPIVCALLLTLASGVGCGDSSGGGGRGADVLADTADVGTDAVGSEDPGGPDTAIEDTGSDATTEDVADDVDDDAGADVADGGVDVSDAADVEDASDAADASDVDTGDAASDATDDADTSDATDDADTADGGDAADTADGGGEEGPCDDPDAIAAATDAIRADFAALTDGVAAQPVTVDVGEDTNGTLRVGLGDGVFPLLTGPNGVFAAASRLGDGRVVAFSGQDFLSSGDRSTLLGEEGVAALLRNAVVWAARDGAATPRALADSAAPADVVASVADADVASIRFVGGLEELRDWSADTIASYDVLIVQVNEWGTLHVGEEDIPAIRAFVEAGGGLVIAGSAMHWSWWLDWSSATFHGDQILDGTAISFDPVSVRAVSQGRLTLAERPTGLALWCAYLADEDLDAAELARMEPLFSAAQADARTEELDAALERLIRDTPGFPASPDDPEARLSANVGAALIGYDWPAVHPWATVFPGAVAAPSALRFGDAEFDTSMKRLIPLGWYAAPGTAVTVTVGPEGHRGAGLAIQLGDRYDDLRTPDLVDAWHRAPQLLQIAPVDADGEVTVGNAFGGSLYLVVPDDYPDDTVMIRTQGAVAQAVYSPDAVEDRFLAALDEGAPQAIVQGRNVRMVVAAEALPEYDNLTDVVAFWEGFVDSHAQLAHEPEARRYAQHWLFDPQVGWGYANATSDRIDFPELATGWAMRTRTGDEDWWLFAHELGHQFQTGDWSGGDVTEVCVNLWSMYTINSYINDGGDRETAGFQGNVIDHAALESARWGTADFFGKLQLYRQLVFEFGWEVYGQVFASYYDPAYPRDAFGSFMDGFAIRFSAISGSDITPFLTHWGYPVSPDAVGAVQALGLPDWLPPGW